MDQFSEFERPLAPQKESGSIISHAWENYKGIFIYALLYLVIAGIVGFIFSLFLPSGSTEGYKEIIDSVRNGKSIDLEEISAIQSSMGFTSYILNFVISAIFGALLFPLSAGLIFIAHKYNSKQNIDIADFFIGYKQNTVNLMLYGLFMSFITTVGYYCCILPGIYLSIVGITGLPIIFFENKTPIEAFKKALNITNSDFGTILVVAILMFLIAYVLGAILCCIGLLFTIGFTFSVKYSTYCAYCGTPYEVNKN